jgi:hypothetical protein
MVSTTSGQACRIGQPADCVGLYTINKRVFKAMFVLSPFLYCPVLEILWGGVFGRKISPWFQGNSCLKGVAPVVANPVMAVVLRGDRKGALYIDRLKDGVSLNAERYFNGHCPTQQPPTSSQWLLSIPGADGMIPESSRRQALPGG